MNTSRTPYEILGEEGVKTLANAFYEAMDTLVEAADVRAMHAEHLDEIKNKLAMYLTGWMGGPPVYQQAHGTVCLTDPHAHYLIGTKERDQWLLCMDEALSMTNAGEELRAMLKEPMFRIADTVRNCESSEHANPDVITFR